MRLTPLLASLLLACSGAAPDSPTSDGRLPADASRPLVDASQPLVDATAIAPDATTTRPECEWGGAPGMCMAAAACGAIPDHSSFSGTCPSGQGCCIDTPDLADNPPFPTGYKLMMQSQVTSEMTAWAVMILHDHVTYPMYSTTTRTFNTLLVLAQVEWHPPDFQNGVIHRGVTLFVPR